MLKSAALAIMALVAFGARSAHAAPPECLSAVDDMIVEYDLPVSQQIPGALSAGKPATPGRKTQPARHALNAEQRKRLQSALHRARLAEARGDEAACMTLLRQAKTIVAGTR